MGRTAPSTSTSLPRSRGHLGLGVLLGALVALEQLERDFAALPTGATLPAARPSTGWVPMEITQPGVTRNPPCTVGFPVADTHLWVGQSACGLQDTYTQGNNTEETRENEFYSWWTFWSEAPPQPTVHHFAEWAVSDYNRWNPIIQKWQASATPLQTFTHVRDSASQPAIDPTMPPEYVAAVPVSPGLSPHDLPVVAPAPARRPAPWSTPRVGPERMPWPYPGTPVASNKPPGAVSGPRNDYVEVVESQGNWVRAEPHRSRPPGRGEREVKARTKNKALLAAGRLAGGAISMATESYDALMAVYDALPQDVKRQACNSLSQDNRASVAEKVLAIVQNLDRLDLGKAAYNLVYNQIQDYLIGKLSKVAEEGAKRRGTWNTGHYAMKLL